MHMLGTIPKGESMKVHDLAKCDWSLYPLNGNGCNLLMEIVVYNDYFWDVKSTSNYIEKLKLMGIAATTLLTQCFYATCKKCYL
jgi:hypothetical protein